MNFIETDKHRSYFFNRNETSEECGIVELGYQDIAAGDSYPLEGYPTGRLFEDEGGRCIENYQIVYIAGGEGTYFDRSGGINCSSELSAGSVMLIRPGYWHSYSPNPSTGWEEYFIGINGRVFEDLISLIFPDIKSNVVKLPVHEEIKSIFEKMLSVAYSEKHPSLEMKSLFCLLIAIINRYAKLTDDDDDTSIIMKARAYMEDHLSSKINFEELSNSLGVSYSWFRKKFKEKLSTAPAQYVQQRRVEKAKFLLLTTGKSVKKICFDCGFASVEYFCIVFKNETGRTPSQYRDK